MSDSVPGGLAEVPTGPGLCALLAPVELSGVADDRLGELLVAEARQLAYQQARVWAVMAEIASRDPMANVPDAVPWPVEQIVESAVEEVRAELRLTRSAARREVEDALNVAALPAVAAALREGRIDRDRAIVLGGACWDLTGEQTAQLLAAVLPDANTVTVTCLEQRVRRVAIALDPAWAERRYRDAVAQRRVVGRLNDDGSATVAGYHLAADEAAAATARVADLAAQAKRAGATAGIDHLRADLFLRLLDGSFQQLTDAEIVAALLGHYPPQPKPDAETGAGRRPAATAPAASNGVATVGVEVRVGLGTLLGLDDRPGELAGLGPVLAPVARDLVARQRRCEWRFAIVNDHGQLLFSGTTRHRPTGQNGAPIRGGLVELQIPTALLHDPHLATHHPEWARVIADLAAQHHRPAPIEQNPTARFPGKPLRREIQIRHRTCLFPGSRHPATNCDLDHRHDHATGGPTTQDNLAPGCRHDHRLKTDRGWRLAKRSNDTYLWISPLGRTHHVHVDPVAPPLPQPTPRVREPQPSELDPPPT